MVNLQLLQNTGYILHVVQCILEAVLYPAVCTFHSLSTAQLMGSWLPDQELNPRHSNGSVNS